MKQICRLAMIGLAFCVYIGMLSGCGGEKTHENQRSEKSLSKQREQEESQYKPKVEGEKRYNREERSGRSRSRRVNDLSLKLVLKVLSRSVGQGDQAKAVNKIYAMSCLNKRTRARHAFAKLLEDCAAELKKGALNTDKVTSELEAVHLAEAEDHNRRSGLLAELHGMMSPKERENAVQRGREAAARRARFPAFSLLPDAGPNTDTDKRGKKTLVERFLLKLDLQGKKTHSLLNSIAEEPRDPKERWAEAEKQAERFWGVFEKEKVTRDDFAKALLNNGGEFKKATVLVEQLEVVSGSLDESQRAKLAERLEKRALKLKERRQRLSNSPTL